MKKNTRMAMDFMGTPIYLGDTVVWPNRQGSSLWMNKGEVTSVNANGTITVTRWPNNPYETARTVTISKLNRVVTLV